RFTANPRALRAALRRATRVVACARSLAASARALAPEVAPRLSVIPNGVEPGVFVDGRAHPHPRPYVAAVGRLVPQKGFDVLLEAPVVLAAALGALLEDGPRRERLGARGRALVCAELTWASVAERYLAVLADAAAPR